MEIFIRNVTFSASENDVKEALAERLHRPPFDTTTPLNFQVALFRAQRSHTHRGIGLVTLATSDAGETFLGIYGVSGVNIRGRVALFSRNKQPPNLALIDAVRNSPWRPPRSVIEEQERAAELSTRIPLATFSFGRVCRDGSFSLEGESYSGSVACNTETRRLDILCKEHSTIHSAPESNPDEFLSTLFASFSFDKSISSTIENSMHYNASRIIAFAISGLRVFLQSDLPPSFERRSRNPMNDLFGDRTTAFRLSGFNDTGVSALTSQMLCLEFKSQHDLETFRRRSHGIHLPSSVHKDVPIHRHNFYARSNWEQLQSLLASLHFRLAFEVDKAVWMSVLDPTEALALGPSLQELQRKTDVQFDEAANIFRHFTTLIEFPTLGVAATLVSKSRRRRRRNRKRAQAKAVEPEVPATNLAGLLAQAVEDYVADVVSNRYVPSEGIYQSYHLVLTPSTQVLDGPLPDQSNSVLRRFKNNDSFLRVSFRDENGSAPRQEVAMGLSIDELLEKRYKDCLNGGVSVAGRRYQFLGYSMSGLKEYSFIFMTPMEVGGILHDAAYIRSLLGDFTKIMDQPAMLGARWAQAFSSSDPSVTLSRDQIRVMGDKTAQDGTIFTDGCCSISSSLMRAVWLTQRRAHKIPFPPSAIQIRCAGAKGVLVANPNFPNDTLAFRPSQQKFITSDEPTLDIATTSARPILTYLNRPLIAMLEHHGVPRESFMELQQIAIDQVHQMKNSLRQASKIFAQHGLGSSFRLPSLFNNIHSLLKLDIGNWSASRRDENVFAHQLIKTAIAFATMHVLREIKHRGHILIPGSYTLIGVSDEWDCLQEGEIYAHIVDERNNVNRILCGRVLITRSPQIHPGDLQFVDAVERPQLAHLTNVVVFSCKGSRSLPSMLGGGDLDGDIYNVITNAALYPPKGYTASPGAYAAIEAKRTPSPCTVSDVVDFVIDYIKSDLLGIISVLHLRIGDLNGYDCNECLILAEKASHAVDFQKRGVPVNFKDLPKPPNKLRPDFLSGEGVNPAESMGDRYYPSKKVLGELYRNVPLEDYRPSAAELEMQRIDGRNIYSALAAVGLRTLGLPGIHAEIDEELMDEMRGNFDEYVDQLMKIAQTHTISKRANAYLSEAELVSGTIQERYGDHRKRREAVSAMNLQIAELVKQLRFEFQSPEYRPKNQDDDDEDFEDEDWADWDEFAGDEARRADRFTRAWAAWLVAEKELEEYPETYGASSFGLIALGTVLEVIKEAKESV
ncbi:RdRP-domain-containing protein [Roridomyces roridus]|uniref:RNA-dependent RNA polymerase n=1 Tax=Roridomyces roridus TaxID=1738132 RepID=A0AAD7B389_9AGAR|nr:RdRP-domain-containing protein [Roridomyces roridus]